MMTSQISKSVDFTKAQKSTYVENEPFFQIKKIHELHIEDYFIAKNSFVAEVTFKSGASNIKGYFVAKISFVAEVTFKSGIIQYKVINMT